MFLTKVFLPNTFFDQIFLPKIFSAKIFLANIFFGKGFDYPSHTLLSTPNTQLPPPLTSYLKLRGGDEEGRTHGPDGAHNDCSFYCIRLCIIYEMNGQWPCKVNNPLLLTRDGRPEKVLKYRLPQKSSLVAA